MRWPYQALSAAFGVADAVVPKALLPSTSPDALIAAAGTNPAPAAREGLRQLITAIDADSKLTFFGKVSLRWDMIRLLRNAQTGRGCPAERRHRRGAGSGADFHSWPAAQRHHAFCIRCWRRTTTTRCRATGRRSIPAQRPGDFDPQTDQRVRAVDKQLKLFAGLAPGFAGMHPITADSPQECSEITAHVFQSLRFDTTFRVPSYLQWVEAHGHHEAFEFHKRFLQYLQAGVPSRWVLKCPDHTFSLEAIMAVYPDARFVVVHRDPIAVLGSVAHLTEVLRKPFLSNIDPAEIGAQVGSRWIEGANLLLEFDRRPDVAPGRKIHVHYEELTRAPLAVIERIYSQFGLALRAQAAAAISEKISARPRGGYGKHAPYSLETFKLSPQNLQTQFAPYVSQYCR